MPGLIHITLTALLASCGVFALGASQHAIPLGPPAHRRLHDENRQVRPRLIQELVRTKRHSAQELVRTQPHLVHDMGWPEIHETSHSRTKTESANFSQSNSPSEGPARTHDAVDENRGVEDEMERMVHLAVPQDSDDYRGPLEAANHETEHLGGPGGGDASQEASGFYGTDTEDRERGEERERRGGEDGEARGGDAREEEEEEEEEETEDLLDVLENNHTTPDLDALIGYSASFHPAASQQPRVSVPGEVHDSGPQEHRGSPVLEAGPLRTELWEADLDEDVQSSGYAVPRTSTVTFSSSFSFSSSSPPPPAPPAPAGAGNAAGTSTLETDTGTDFGLLGSFTRGDEKQEGVTQREEEEEEEDEGDEGLTHMSSFITQKPTVAEVGLAPSREPLQPSREEEEQPAEAGHGWTDSDRDEDETEKPGNRHSILPLTTGPLPTANVSLDWLEMTTPLHTQQQVVCLDWSELAGRGYVVLNMTHNLNCEEFRVDRGVRLLRVLERVFARRMNSPEGSWMIYLSKPTHQQHQLLMNVASENGVIATKDVLDMLGEIRKYLDSVGIQNYSAASSCQSRPSQTRSDYGKLFVVLVIIGSICMVIITSGFIYICWQRRLPATKTTFRAEELHFVENGCHDNPMLDVTNDGQPEMREKKPSANGLAGGGGEGGRAESSRWQVFVNQAATEEDEEEQDTHL